MSKKQIKTIKPAGPIVLQASQEVTPMVMMQMAQAQNAPVEQMERLWELNVKVEAANAKKSYVAAMAQFKKNPPAIMKDRHVSYETTKGVTEYFHSSLGSVTEKIVESLAEYGFSHKWNVDQLEGGQIKVECVITHEQGHSESVPMQSGRDDSGGKNNIQALASTVTYLQRYTLLAATGLATHDMDDDGVGAEAPQVEYITEDQVNTLHSKITENELNEVSFISWLKKDLKCDSLEGVSKKAYKIVDARINSAINAKNKGDK